MSGRPNLAEIRAKYQVQDDEMIRWSPKIGGLEADFLGEAKVTRTEGEMLDRLTAARGLFGLNKLRSISSAAFDEATSRFADNPVPEGVPESERRDWQFNDGHRDAFRHTYWNALMAKQYGNDWAEAFATAHEGLPGNDANREAMDLYNNEVGRRIAKENPAATSEQLAALIERAVTDGSVVVIDRNGDLAWSDQVRIGQHGLSRPEVLAPAIRTPRAEPLPGMSEEPGRRQQASPADPPRAAPAGTRDSADSFSAVPSEANEEPRGRTGPADPDHPDHAMLAQIKEGVRRIDTGLGKSFDASSERLSHCLLPECKSAGLSRVDHVVMGKDGVNLFAVQGQLEDPAHLRAHVATGQGIRTPIEQSDERLLAVNQALIQQSNFAREQELSRPPHDQVRGGHTLGHVT